MGYTANGAQIFLQDASGKTRMDYNGTASATWHVLNNFEVDGTLTANGNFIVNGTLTGGLAVTGGLTTDTIASSSTANFGGTVSFPATQFAANSNVAWGSGSNAPNGAHAVPQKWLEIYSNGVFQGFVPCF